MPKNKKGKKGPVCEWFIEPMNPAANDLLAQEFQGQDAEWVIDTDREEHLVFRVSWVVVDKFFRAVPQASPRPQYKVYSRTGGTKTKRVKFFEPKKKKAKVAVGDEPPAGADPEDVF